MATANDKDKQALYDLLRAFDAFCQEAGIAYFAIEETLVGAVTYNDFIPESPMLKLGMLRRDFNRLRALCKPDGAFGGAKGKRAASAGNGNTPLSDTLRLSCEVGSNIKHFVEFALPQNVEQQAARARIHEFDAVTDDFDLTTFQRFRMENWLKLRRKAPRATRHAIERHVDAIAQIYEQKPHDEVAILLALRRRRYPAAALAHVQRILFGPDGDMISIPDDTRCWIEQDKVAERERVRLVQKDSLAILHEVDRVCRENGISYFLAAGTLLGTLRYGGFIPWDDDIDIGMLRPDYERFLQVAPCAIDSRFFVQNRSTDPDVEYLYTKVRMRGTEYVTDYTRYRQQEKGISLDVFPFDKAPANSPDFPAFAEEAYRLEREHRYVARHRVTGDYPRRPAHNPMEAIGHALVKHRGKHFDQNALARTQEAFERHVTSYANNSDANYAVSYLVVPVQIRLDDLLPYRKASFEGREFPIPRNPNPLMTVEYGQGYLDEPPEHLRHGHPILSWRTSDGHSGL